MPCLPGPTTRVRNFAFAMRERLPPDDSVASTSAGAGGVGGSDGVGGSGGGGGGGGGGAGAGARGGNGDGHAEAAHDSAPPNDDAREAAGMLEVGQKMLATSCDGI